MSCYSLLWNCSVLGYQIGQLLLAGPTGNVAGLLRDTGKAVGEQLCVNVVS